MKKKYVKEVSVCLTEEQYHKLKFLALVEGKPISVVIRDCIKIGLHIADLALSQFMREYFIPIMEHGATLKLIEKGEEDEEG